MSEFTVWWKEAEYRDDPSVPFRPAGTLVDFSGGGLGLMTSEGVKEGERIVIRVRYRSDRSHALGRIAWRKMVTKQFYEVGIELDEIEHNFILGLVVRHCRSLERQRTFIFIIISILASYVGFVIGSLVF